MRQIVRFNWPVFAGTAVTAGLLAIASRQLPSGRARMAASIGSGVASYGLLASMVTSWWIYDHSEITHWTWLRTILPSTVERWANLTTGFDDTTDQLCSILPGTGLAIDLFDPHQAHERSILRARALRPPVPGSLVGRPERLPLDEASTDGLLLLFAAHEVRDRARRAALFHEAGRALRPGGKLVVVEHLRDAANAIVFGPGVMHFYGRDEWLAAGREGGLRLTDEFRITPFVRVFGFARP